MEPDNRDFLELVRDTEATITALLSALGVRLATVILRNARRNRRTQALVDQAIREYVDRFRAIVTGAVANTAGLQADKNAAALLPLLRAAGASNEEEFMGGRFRGYRETIRQRFPTQKHPEDQRTFEQRVVNVRRGFQRTVYQMVQTGVDTGIDPRKLAYQIRDAVVMTPKDPQTQAYREAARLRHRASTYVYRGAPSGSIQYNSMRIVRSEMGNIYRRSVVDFFDDRPYLEDYDWVKSNRHPKVDQCDGWAAGGPYTSRNLPPGHPNDLCRVVARIMSQERLKRLIASGQIN